MIILQHIQIKNYYAIHYITKTYVNYISKKQLEIEICSYKSYMTSHIIIKVIYDKPQLPSYSGEKLKIPRLRTREGCPHSPFLVNIGPFPMQCKSFCLQDSFSLSFYSHLAQWFSRCGLMIGNIIVIWEVVRTANFCVSLQVSRIQTLRMDVINWV